MLRGRRAGWGALSATRLRATTTVAATMGAPRGGERRMRLGLSREGARRLGTWVWNGALAAGAATLAGAVGLTWLSGVKARGLESRPAPAATYAEALTKLARLESAEDEKI